MRVLRALILIILVAFGAAYLKTMLRDEETVKAEAREAAAKEAAKEARRQSVTIEKFAWGKGGFDNVMLADFTLKNSNSFPVKDVVVTCEHTANSGTQIDSSTRTIYEAIKANGSKAIRRFNMGLINTQVARSSCKVTGFADG